LAESKVLLEQHTKSIDDLTYEKDALDKKKADLEGRLGGLEVEYEELLDKTIADEEAQAQKNVDIAETIKSLKVSCAFKSDRT
jgi:kinesin family protein 5